MKRIVSLIFVLAAFLAVCSCATETNSVPRAIREYLDSYDWRLDMFRKSDVSDLSGFRSHERWYEVDGRLADVWSVYTHIRPDEQWKGPIARFGALYDPETSEFITKGSDHIPNVEEGQILFLDLLIESFLHVPTSFQISRIDENRKIIEFTYLEQNTSHGCQELSFYPAADGKSTLIRHRSWFRSDSPVRDALFYRSYHTQTVDEFHWSVAKRSGLDIDAMSPREIKRKGLLPSEQPLQSDLTAVSFD